MSKEKPLPSEPMTSAPSSTTPPPKPSSASPSSEPSAGDSKAKKADEELLVIGRITRLLKELKPEARRRVMLYLTDKAEAEAEAEAAAQRANFQAFAGTLSRK